ncbi:uncharacterized protein LOC107262972 isoform X2 [Cephus cinctus]|uniref:Uncharacterized protein LOC107262972 isoform X2 n=1 Tax=Cephus cinctus TaxID=211228 RepID=A0AAJ7FCM8_CEPCN|nr:uncharacterized protein LOC107262972 isoform X2 [Cephus cinctus]
MRLHVFVLFLFVPLSSATTVPFEDCGSHYYIESVEISGCNNYPCILTIGSTYNFTLAMQAYDHINLRSLNEEVYFKVNHVRKPAFVTSDPCLDNGNMYSTGNTCAPQSGQTVYYKAELAVNALPPLPAVLYWTLKNSQEILVCYKVTVILQS